MHAVGERNGNLVRSADLDPFCLVRHLLKVIPTVQRFAHLDCSVFHTLEMALVQAKTVTCGVHAVGERNGNLVRFQPT